MMRCLEIRDRLWVAAGTDALLELLELEPDEFWMSLTSEEVHRLLPSGIRHPSAEWGFIRRKAPLCTRCRNSPEVEYSYSYPITRRKQTAPGAWQEVVTEGHELMLQYKIDEHWYRNPVFGSTINDLIGNIVALRLDFAIDLRRLPPELTEVAEKWAAARWKLNIHNPNAGLTLILLRSSASEWQLPEGFNLILPPTLLELQAIAILWPEAPLRVLEGLPSGELQDVAMPLDLQGYVRFAVCLTFYFQVQIRSASMGSS